MESTEMQEPEAVKIPTAKNAQVQTITFNLPEGTANAGIDTTKICWKPYDQKCFTPVNKVKRFDSRRLCCTVLRDLRISRSNPLLKASVKCSNDMYAKIKTKYTERNEMLALADQMKQMSTTVNAKSAAEASEP